MLRLSIWTVADKFKFIDGCSRSNTYDMDNQARSSHANHGHKYFKSDNPGCNWRKNSQPQRRGIPSR